MAKKIACIFFLVFGQIFSQANFSDKTQISILTCDSGSELYSLFGHTGLRIFDPINNIDVVYNFGMFDFGTPNFYLKFIKGDLMYFGSIERYEDFLYQYQYFQRAVVEQKLSLSSEQINDVYNELSTLLNAENKYYQYKFIDTNCTTKVQDVLNNALDANLIKTGENFPSYRAVINDYLKYHFFEKLGINLIFGSATDKTATQLFLPKELEDSIDATSFLGQKNTILNYKNPNRFVWWNSIYIFLVIVFVMTFIKPKILSNVWLILQGLLGIFFLLVGFYSFHKEVVNNYNTLILSPLLLFYLVSVLKKTMFIKVTTLSYLLSVLVFITTHYNKDHYWLMMIFVISNLMIIFRNEKKWLLLPFIKKHSR